MSPARPWMVLAIALAQAACSVSTDRERYGVGDQGVVTLENLLPVDAFFANCPAYVSERLEGDRWVPKLPGPDDAIPLCVSSAQRVPAESSVSLPFSAELEPGTWRLRIQAAVRCPERGLFAECDQRGSVHSTSFEVASPGGGCFVGGCSGEICADEPLVSACVWWPEFACYRDAVCGRFGDPDIHGGCAWQTTPELRACLDELEGPRDGPGPEAP